MEGGDAQLPNSFFFTLCCDSCYFQGTAQSAEKQGLKVLSASGISVSTSCDETASTGGSGGQSTSMPSSALPADEQVIVMDFLPHELSNVKSEKSLKCIVVEDSFR